MGNFRLQSHLIVKDHFGLQDKVVLADVEQVIDVDEGGLSGVLPLVRRGHLDLRLRLLPLEDLKAGLDLLVLDEGVTGVEGEYEL